MKKKKVDQQDRKGTRHVVNISSGPHSCFATSTRAVEMADTTNYSESQYVGFLP
jgi:hypothetical protein